MFGQRKKRAEKEFGPDLNRVVTPMLDMTFQLLFYFVIQFKPIIEEGQVDLSLPAQDAASQSSVYQPDLDNEKPDEYTIHINSVLHKGSDKPVILKSDYIVSMRFTSKVETTPPFQTDDLLGEMEKKLKSIPKYVESKDKKKPPTIKLQINNELKYEHVMDLLDRCRRIGKEINIKDIGLMGYPRDRGGPAG
jgi:biopolymer transport protein ExbD